MTDPRQYDEEELRQLKRDIRRLRRELKAKPPVDPAIQAAQVTADTTLAVGKRASKLALISGIGGPALGGAALVIVALVNNSKTTPPASNPSTNTVQSVDCTDEIEQALDIFRQNPQITIPYSSDDPAQQLCQLNERIEQARNAGNP